MSKPRADSWLKTLTEDRQAQVIEWINKPNDRDEKGKSISKTGGIEYARQQIAADGISVTPSQLSDFYSWYHLRQDFSEAETETQDILELIRSIDPSVTAQQLEVAGNLIFTKRALRDRNQERFVQMQELDLAKKTALTRGRQKDEELLLKRKKFQRDTARLFIDWFADEEAKRIAASGGTKAERIEAIGRHVFPDWDED